MEGPDIQEARILDYSVSHKKWIAHASSLSIDGSPTSNPPSFNIATWNIWEDDRATKYRYPYILHLLFGSSSPFDVITLQEVTGEFSTALLQHRTVQRDWLVTDLMHQLELLPNPYGTMILVKKSRFQGYTFKARFHAFESSYMARGINFIEVYRNVAPSPGRNPSRQLIMRIGTAHFESHPGDLRKRKAQFEVSANILTSSSSATVPAILTGDCNITSYAELTPLINPTQGRPTFVDALLTPRPLRSDQDPFRSHPTMGLFVLIISLRTKWELQITGRILGFWVMNLVVVRKRQRWRKGRMGEFMLRIIWAFGLRQHLLIRFGIRDATKTFV